jgi:hypothetical protein
MMTMHRIALAGLLSLGLGVTPAVAQVSAPPDAPATPPAPRPPAPPQAFPTPEAGVAALVAAMRADDEARLIRVVGERATSLVRSGDRVADRAARARLVASYDQKNSIERPSPDRAILVVGDNDWPLPIPLLLRGGQWRFDAREGAQEIIDRRVGRNELDTIEALRAVVDAQDDFARTAGRQGGFRSYARRFFSSPGQRDGLYWPTRDDEPESPLGPLFAQASAGGYTRRGPGEAPRPFHGYFFRMLESQGPAAPGGALDFVVNGRMIFGFGAIAWPAQYGASGIQTFIVSHNGVVYQRDLGPETARLAAAITAFNPEPGWVAVEE